jgi:hypothetical protein
VPGHLVAVEALKLAFSILLYIWQRRNARGEFYQGLEQDEGQDLSDLSEQNQEAPEHPTGYSSSPLIPGTIQSTIYIVSIAALYCARNYFVCLVSLFWC